MDDEELIDAEPLSCLPNSHFWESFNTPDHDHKNHEKISFMSKDVLRNNRIEDVRWLCSLSESELDVLVSLKQMAMRRSSVIKHESLARKFDLKMLRALSFILMEYLKGELKDKSTAPGLIKCPDLLDKSRLLSSKVDENFSNMSIEELCAYMQITQVYGTSLNSPNGHTSASSSGSSQYSI